MDIKFTYFNASCGNIIVYILLSFIMGQSLYVQSNEKIIMNPLTMFCHLAGSLTQNICSNEPQLIFTKDKEIGSLQLTPFHFSFVDLPVLK